MDFWPSVSVSKNSVPGWHSFDGDTRPFGDFLFATLLVLSIHWRA
jgi:hypothetical protein